MFYLFSETKGSSLRSRFFVIWKNEEETIMCKLTQETLFGLLKEYFAMIPDDGKISTKATMFFNQNFEEGSEADPKCKRCSKFAGEHRSNDDKAPEPPSYLTRSMREAKKTFELNVAKKVVQGRMKWSDGDCLFSGVLIDCDGTVLSTKHQLHQNCDLGNPRIDGDIQFTMCMLGEQCDLLEEKYQLVKVDNECDLAWFEPCGKFNTDSYFRLRKIPHHHDLIFCGGRVEESAVFFLSEGILNYNGPNEAVVNAHADHGWSGGPIFHFHDTREEPTLVGLVMCSFGQKNTVTSIQLLPDSVLTEGKRADAHFYSRNLRQPLNVCFDKNSKRKLFPQQSVSTSGYTSVRTSPDRE